MKRIISMCLSAVLLLSLCATGAAKIAQAEEKQKVIVIDAGHQTRAMSATEPIGPGSSQRKAKVTGGASGCVTHLPEYKLNLQVAKKLQKELVNRGYKVIMVRTKNNVRMSNVQRAKVANKYKADAFIRIHANSAGSSSVKGALTIVTTQEDANRLNSQIKLCFFITGQQDHMMDDSARRFVNQCDLLGLNNMFLEVKGTGHDDRCWDRAFYTFMQYAFK